MLAEMNQLEEIAATRPLAVMEVCGGQTHSIVKYGIYYLLPKEVELVHGPGCPVSVTPLEMIDRAHAIARRPGVIFCSFGDTACTRLACRLVSGKSRRRRENAGNSGQPSSLRINQTQCLATP